MSENQEDEELRNLKREVAKLKLEANLRKSLADQLAAQKKIADEAKVEVEKKSKARMLFNQKIISDDSKNQICEGSVEVCMVDIETKKPKPFPNDLLLIFDNGEAHG